MTFDPFEFLADRKAGLPVGDADKSGFVLYNVVQAVSMDYRFRRITHMANEISFSHLPPDIQAMAFNSLRGVNIDTRWHRAKTSLIRENDENVEHAMAILNTSHNTVRSLLKYNLIDMDRINEAYYRRYDPQHLLEKKRKTK